MWFDDMVVHIRGNPLQPLLLVFYLILNLKNTIFAPFSEEKMTECIFNFVFVTSKLLIIYNMSADVFFSMCAVFWLFQTFTALCKI